MELFEEKLIRGSVHPYIGMEAIAVGVCAALGADDFITSTHRGHGHCIAKGLDLKLMMAEIIGREDGYCRGRGGSMHITAIDKGCSARTRSSPARPRSPSAPPTGCACRGKDAVVVCFFGDGAANQGILHEACNLAPSSARRPSSSARTTSGRSRLPRARLDRIEDIADRAAGYGFPGVVVDGNDVLAVRERTAEAVARARAGDGPDADRGEELPDHAALGGDARPTSARREELDAWRARDPILRFSRHARRGARRRPARLERDRGSRRGATSRRRSSSRSPRRGPSRRRRSRTSTRRPTG